MKARHHKQRAANRGHKAADVAPAARKGIRAHVADEAEALANGGRRARKHLGKVHGKAPMVRADRKPRRNARTDERPGKGYGGGLPPASNDNEDFEARLVNQMKNWRAGGYPAWRKDIANNNTLLPLPGGKK